MVRGWLGARFSELRNLCKMRIQYRLIRTRLFHSLDRFHSDHSEVHLRSKSLVRARPSSVSRKAKKARVSVPSDPSRVGDSADLHRRRTV